MTVYTKRAIKRVYTVTRQSKPIGLNTWCRETPLGGEYALPDAHRAIRAALLDWEATKGAYGIMRCILYLNGRPVQHMYSEG